MLPRKAPCNLDRILHSLRPRRAIKQPIQPTRQARPQQLRQLQHLIMIPNIHLSMDNSIQLRLCGGDDSRMRMTGVEDANAGGEIEEGAAAGRGDVGSTAMCER